MDNLSKNQFSILHLMAEYEKYNQTGNNTYKTRRLLWFMQGRLDLDEDTVIEELYSLARNGRYVRYQGNVGLEGIDIGARPEYVEVALTLEGKELFS